MATHKKGTHPRSITNDHDDGRSVAIAPGYPLLSLRHLQPGFGIKDLSAEAAHAFVDKWAQRSQFTWGELRTHQRHGLGSEKLPSNKIKPYIPEHLRQDHYLVYRHLGNHACVGFLQNDVFCVVWIEKEYADLYDHG